MVVLSISPARPSAIKESSVQFTAVGESSNGSGPNLASPAISGSFPRVIATAAGTASPAAQQETAVPVTEAVPALCYRCHRPFAPTRSTHAPVREGACMDCHVPHDSGTPKLLARPVKDLCGSCHPKTTDHAYVHGPVAVGECTYCHDPHGSANARLLVKSGAELCADCHFDLKEELRRTVIHPPFAAGCTSCHDPHGSSEKKLLSSAGVALCFSCHPAIESAVSATGQHVHQPVTTERGCASCHSPHASNGPKLLPKAGKDLCLGCHKDVIKRTDTELHGPIKGGKCTPCHDPHGSPNSKLLVKPYPSSFHVPYSDTEFALCFKCHSRALVSTAVTSTATRFRDGNRNLHFLHVNRRDLGRTCTACHVIHGGTNPPLIAGKVRFGTWDLPLNFAKTETGGSCAPGCHQPVSYANTIKKAENSDTPASADKDRLQKKKR